MARIFCSGGRRGRQSGARGRGAEKRKQGRTFHSASGPRKPICMRPFWKYHIWPAMADTSWTKSCCPYDELGSCAAKNSFGCTASIKASAAAVDKEAGQERELERTRVLPWHGRHVLEEALVLDIRVRLPPERVLEDVLVPTRIPLLQDLRAGEGGRVSESPRGGSEEERERRTSRKGT